MGKRWIFVVAFLFVAIILIGEVITYVASGNRYDSSALRNGEYVDYSVYSSGTNDYSAVLIDNDGFEGLNRLVIYVDGDYSNNYTKAKSMTSLCNIEPVYYSEQIQRSLWLRSFDNVTECNAEGLIDYLNETKADPGGCGILSLAYALPGEIYSGNQHDPLLDWIDAGGSLYWVGSIPGALYYDNGSMIFVENSQELFFGSNECINSVFNLIPEKVGGAHTKALCLIDYQLYLGVDTSALTVPFLAMGCMKGGIASSVLVKHGDGMVGQFAGEFQITQIEDVVQILASKMCYKSVIVDYTDGRVTRATVKGSFNTADGDTVYIFIGKNYSVYGRAYDV